MTYSTIAIFAFTSLACSSIAAEPTTVSLQGRLSESGTALDSAVTLRLSLFDDADPLIGSKVDLDGDGTTQGADEDVVIRNVMVSDGLFETDFGPLAPTAFDGTPRFLQIEVNGTALGRVPFRATPGIAETVVSPDGSTQLVVTSGAGGVALGGSNPDARLDVRPLPTQTAGTIQSVSIDVATGRSTITRSAGFPATVLPGDVLLALSPDGQSRTLVGMVINVDNGAGTVETDFVTSGALAGWTLEVRQPLLRIGANPDPNGYADGQPRSGLIVTDDGRVGINDTTPRSELTVDGAAEFSQDSAFARDLTIGLDLVVGRNAGVTDRLTADRVSTDRLDGAMATILSGANNVTQGYLQIGVVLIQWGRYTAPSSGIRVINLARPYNTTNEMSAQIQSLDNQFTQYALHTFPNTSQLRISHINSGSGSPGSGSGNWMVIGRAAAELP